MQTKQFLVQLFDRILIFSCGHFSGYEFTFFNQMKTHLVVQLTVVFIVFITTSIPLRSFSQKTEGIIYLDAPRNIDLQLYLTTWPSLKECIGFLTLRDTLKAEGCLRNLINMGTAIDGALNLTAQIQRKRGKLDQAGNLIEEAINLSPREHLHYFQKALIAFEQRAKASLLFQWTWHLRTKDAYERALVLAPRMLPYRYYVFYSYINTPFIGGGDKNKGLKIAQDGITLGMQECYLMRADAYLALDKMKEAFADYDTCISLHLFKQNLESYRNAGYAALKKKDWRHSKRYFDYLITCRPDLPQSYDCLGDYYLAVNDRPNAINAYKAALAIRPGFSRSVEKLKELK
jgi:tetratricopeptide (TPR) repeat protein